MSIYLDNAATTAVLPEASAVACDTMTNLYANPASLHTFGFEAEDRRRKNCLKKAEKRWQKPSGAKAKNFFSHREEREAIILPCSVILKQNAEDG